MNCGILHRCSIVSEESSACILRLSGFGGHLSILAFLRLMGDDNEAKRFSYSLEVSANGRKLIWQGIPRSIRDSSRKVRESLDGPVIQRNLTLFFLVVRDES